jgi:hypothetical protein
LFAFNFRDTGFQRMEIRLHHNISLILLLAAVALAAAALALPRQQISPLASGIPAAPTPQAAVTQTLSGQRITFADESAAWDWQATRQDDLATWVQQSPNPISTIRVTLTDEKNLGVPPVGVGYSGDKDLAPLPTPPVTASPIWPVRLPSGRARRVTIWPPLSPPLSSARSATPG